MKDCWRGDYQLTEADGPQFDRKLPVDGLISWSLERLLMAGSGRRLALTEIY